MIKQVSIRGFSSAFWLAVIVLLCVLARSVVGADTQPSLWLGTSNPSLVKDFDLIPSESLPSTKAGLGNIDCTNLSVKTRPAKLTQTQLMVDSCFIKTTFGIADPNGVMRFNGSDLAGKSVNYPGYSSGLIAIPNSLDFINFTSAPGGLYLHLTRSVPAPMSIDVSSSGEVTYRFVQPASASIADKAGNLLPAQTNSLSFSTNGKWMVVDSPNRAMLRVNLETLEVLPFRPAFNYNIGVDPAAQTAISNDGRYAIVASRNFNTLTIFDLSTCAAVPNIINAPVTCQSRDLLSFAQSAISGYFGIFNIRFADNGIISLYGIGVVNGSVSRSKFYLLAPGQTKTKVSYLAMGDSFASGEGDGQGSTYYEEGTDEKANKCHLSKRSYPYLIRDNLGISEFHSVACSGAVTSHVTQETQYPNSNTTHVLGDWIPGRQSQDSYLDRSRPDILTIMIGGNDAGFATVLTECATSHYKIPLPNTCKYAADPLEKANIAKNIADQYGVLKETYKALVRSTDSKTKIYVLGYPMFIKGSGGSCGINVPLNDQERLFVSESIGYMNKVIKAAADSVGVYYIDIENTLEGRNLCSEVDDSLMAMNGMTEGNDLKLPWWARLLSQNVTGIVVSSTLGIGNESFHPNQKAHQLFRDRLLNLTNNDPVNFAVCSQPQVYVCPRGDGKVPTPNTMYFGNDATSYVSGLNGGTTGSVAPPKPINMVSTESGQAQLNLSYLKPSSQVTVAYSDTGVGNYQTDAKGSLSIALPNNLPPGNQTIRVQATDMSGVGKNYYQVVYVLGPSGDLNNNGVPDNEEMCGFITPSQMDKDFDGVDDACDGEVTVPEALSQPLYRTRNGLLELGENPHNIYIERNIVSSKTVLGLDDFDPDNDGWSLIALYGGNSSTGLVQDTILYDPKTATASSDLSTLTLFKNLMLPERRMVEPVLNFWDWSSRSCITIKPASLGVKNAGADYSTAPSTISLSCTPETPKVTIELNTMRTTR